MSRRSFVCSLSAVALAALAARASEIGIYASPDCSGCESTIPPRAWTDTLFIAVRSDPVPPAWWGVCGAAFRVLGLPTEWEATALPSNPEATLTGNPFDAAGVMISVPWYGCSEAPCVPLFTVVLVPGSRLTDVHLAVAALDPPSNSWLTCPYVHLPDSPGPTVECVSGGEIIVNPANDHCGIGVQQLTWTRLRARYRDP